MLALGHIAFQACLSARRELALPVPSPKPRFGHGVSHELGGMTLPGSCHPSQQNTFTRRLTKAVFEAIFQRARRLIDQS